MPYDGLLLAPAATLSQALRELEITPVPLGVLNLHKDAEVAKHPGSMIGRFCQRHAATIGVTVFNIAELLALAMYVSAAISVIMLVIGYLFAMLIGMAAIFVLWLCTYLVGILADGGGPSFKGQAEWVETDYCFGDAPQDMIDMAIQIIQRLPGSYAICGRLIQNEINLDPYLLVKFGREVVVIGVWDDNRIVYIANQE